MNNLVIPDTLHRESLVFDLLDNSNYASWRKNMRILFMRMSLLDLIDHVRPPDATPAWETANKWAFISKKNFRRDAPHLHVLLCAPHILPLVM